MIQNRNQLLQMSSMWINEAKNDIRNQAIAFMRETNSSEEMLANILGISQGELDCILRGNSEITLSTFAKILIATDNMIEIKPLSQALCTSSCERFPTPNEVRNICPRPIHRPMPRSSRNERPLDNRPPLNRPFGQMPMPQRSMCQNTPTQCVGNNEVCLNLDEMSRSELIGEILKNGWEHEIDINLASRSQMIAFLGSKGQSNVDIIHNNTEPHATSHTVCQEPLEPMDEEKPFEYIPLRDDTYVCNKTDDANACYAESTQESRQTIRENDDVTQLAEMLRNNPQLADTLRNILR